MSYRTRVFRCNRCGTKYGIPMGESDFVCLNPACILLPNQIKYTSRDNFKTHEYEDITMQNYIQFSKEGSENEWRVLKKHQKRGI